jgi:hypothetical protein
MTASPFCLSGLLSLIVYFLFYCVRHNFVTHSGVSQSKSLHTDWVAYLKVSALLPLSSNRPGTRPSISSPLKYFCHLTRCRPKLCVRNATYTLLKETGIPSKYSWISTEVHCQIPKGRNLNSYCRENVKSFLLFWSIACWYRNPWKCCDIEYFYWNSEQEP